MQNIVSKIDNNATLEELENKAIDIIKEVVV